MRLASLLRRSDTSNDPPARAPAIQRPTQSTPQIPPVSSPLTPSSSAGLNAVAGPSSPAGSSNTAPIAIRIPNSDSNRTSQPIPSYDEALSTSASAIPGSPDFSEGAGIARMSLRGRAMSANMINTQSMAMRDRMAISTSDTVWNEEDEESDDDPVPRGSGTRSNLSSSLPRMLDPTLRRNTISALRPSAYAVQSSEYGLFNDSQLSLGLPTPPTETPPEYSPHLARDELRLISTVHLDENHPAAVMFSSMASTAMMTSAVRALHPEPTRLSDGNLCVTGNKKLKVSITRGGERYNNGTGPTFIRLGRKGVVEGSIHLGKVDHVTGLDISIIGLVNTSYYVRGQYTLIDTLPLARRLVVIYPEDKAGTYDNMNTTQPSAAANATPSEAPPVPETTPLQRQTTTSSTSADSANPPADPPPTESTPPAPDTSEQPSASTSAPPPFPVNTVTIGKDTFLAPFQEFKFSLKIPDNHYRDPNSELPPTSQIYQVGMQASIEYVLRVKCSRKGWRMNEGLAIPVLYEPRAYITPRRLRALTTHDALNPGWRTIKLNGGKPKPTTESEPVAPVLPGVDVQLLLPSPPILYVEHGTAPSPIPFHLHFHSSSALPLATFSDPRQCKFVVRLMRVASMKIGVEKEVRRVEIPTKCELWQEGGERFVLGEDDVDAVETTSTGPTLRRGSLGGATNPGPGERRRSFTERRQSFLRRMSNAPSNEDSTPAQGQPPTSPVSPTSPTSISLAGSGDIGLSRSISASTITSPMVIPGPPTMARAVSNAPVVSSIQEESEITSRGASPEDASVPAITTAITEQTPSAGELPATVPAYSPIAEGSEVTRHPLLAPLTLDATDVHLLGQLTIYPTMAGTTVARHLIQSFLSPEIGVTYVVEVGMQPKKGAVKETFSHVWGGGLIEVVLGPRPEPEASEPAPGATGAVGSVMATSTS